MRMNEFFYLFVIMSILIITRSNPLIKEFQMQSIAKHIFFPNKDYETILDGMVDLAVYFVNKILNTTESQTISPEANRLLGKLQKESAQHVVFPLRTISQSTTFSIFLCFLICQ